MSDPVATNLEKLSQRPLGCARMQPILLFMWDGDYGVSKVFSGLGGCRRLIWR
jgi:hypothetical protein